MSILPYRPEGRFFHNRKEQRSLFSAFWIGHLRKPARTRGKLLKKARMACQYIPMRSIDPVSIHRG
jgi:hypothetical protein